MQSYENIYWLIFLHFIHFPNQLKPGKQAHKSNIEHSVCTSGCRENSYLSPCASWEMHTVCEFCSCILFTIVINTIVLLWQQIIPLYYVYIFSCTLTVITRYWLWTFWWKTFFFFSCSKNVVKALRCWRDGYIVWWKSVNYIVAVKYEGFPSETYWYLLLDLFFFFFSCQVLTDR